MTTSAPKNIFAGIGEASATLSSQYVREGRYVALIARIHQHQNRKGRDAVIIEMKCLAVLDQKNNASPHAPGDSITHYIQAGGDMFLPNVKAVIIDLTRGIDPSFDGNGIGEDEWIEMCMAMVGPDQPFAGLVVEVDGTMITTRAGNPFTKISYPSVIRPSNLGAILERAGVDPVLVLGQGKLEEMIAEEEAA